MQLSRTERWILANQYRILAALCPNEAESYAHAREGLERGYELHFKQFAEHIYEETMSEDACREVLDILDMYSILKHCYDQLEDKSGIDEYMVRYHGFDGNNETEQLGYVHYFCKQSGGRFRELGNPGELNSHARMLPMYRRMLGVWRDEMKKKYELTKEDILRITKVGKPPR